MTVNKKNDGYCFYRGMVFPDYKCSIETFSILSFPATHTKVYGKAENKL